MAVPAVNEWRAGTAASPNRAECSAVQCRPVRCGAVRCQQRRGPARLPTLAVISIAGADTGAKVKPGGGGMPSGQSLFYWPGQILQMQQLIGFADEAASSAMKHLCVCFFLFVYLLVRHTFSIEIKKVSLKVVLAKVKSITVSLLF